MSTPAATRVHVHLVADTDAELCGRPAIDWLLDTVEQLAPASVTVDGPAAQAVRDRLATRLPQLDGSAGAGVFVVLRCSTPLLRPATVRRAIDAASAGAGTGTAAIVAERPMPWWDAEPAVGRYRFAAVAAGPDARSTALAVLDGAALDGAVLDGAVLEGAVLDGTGDSGDAGPATITAARVESLRTGDPTEYAQAATALYERIAAGWVARGAVIDDPATTRIDARVRLDAGVRILPNTYLHGDTTIAAGTSVGPVVTIQDSTIGTDCRIRYAVCQDVQVGDRVNIGPFCWLRSGTRLGSDTRAGAFVEVADSVVGDGTSIPHLGGLFSTDVGRNCNIAGMSAPANFNGASKNRVVIGDDVSIGAGNILVAPITIGDGASTAAGSTITTNVPAGGLGFARAQQHNFPGWQGGAARRTPDLQPNGHN